MPSNSSDFNQILNITPSGHLLTIHNVIKDTSPSQECQNHHQLQQEFLLIYLVMWRYPSCCDRFYLLAKLLPKQLPNFLTAGQMFKLKKKLDYQNLISSTFSWYLVTTLLPKLLWQQWCGSKSRSRTADLGLLGQKLRATASASASMKVFLGSL